MDLLSDSVIIMNFDLKAMFIRIVPMMNFNQGLSRYQKTKRTSCDILGYVPSARFYLNVRNALYTVVIYLIL